MDPAGRRRVLGLMWVVVGIFVRAQPISWFKPITLYVAFTAWSATGLMITVDLDYFYLLFMTTLKVMAVTWIALQCMRTRKDFLICCMLLGIAAVIVLVQGMDTIMRSIQYAQAWEAKGARASGTLLGFGHGYFLMAPGQTNNGFGG